MNLDEFDEDCVRPVVKQREPLVHKSDRGNRKALVRAVYASWLASDEGDDMLT